MSWSTIPKRKERIRVKKVTPEECAKRRLMREARELKANPVENCSAAPLEKNIFEWHANISTPEFDGVCFHFIINFPKDYPKSAPKVRPCQVIKHPNVFGDWICLDILTMSEETEKTPYRGWTSAYTVSTLLTQLQCFLFDYQGRTKDSYAIQEMYKSAWNFSCRKCGHKNHTPFPELKRDERSVGFYKLLRNVDFRNAANESSKRVCELPKDRIILVNEVKGDWLQVDMRYHKEADSSGRHNAWCRLYSMSGVNVEKVLGADCGPGFYTCKEAAPVQTQALKKVGLTFARGERVGIETIVPCGSMVVGKVNVLPTKYRERFSGRSNLYIDMSNATFLNKFEEIIEKENNLDGESYWLNEFYGLILDIIVEMCDVDTCSRLALVHEDFQKKVDESKVMQMRNYKCFYTLKNIRDKDVTLGFGIRCEVMDKKSRHKKMFVNGRERDWKRPVLQRMHPSFDLMSHEAFVQHKVRVNVWKDVEFDAFLPLYINKEHGKAAILKAEECIKFMWKKEKKSAVVTDERLLNTFAKLMNTTIVNMNKCIEDLEVAELQLFDSIKAINGYMSFHHMLLAFALKYPCLVSLANERIAQFIKDPAQRDKENTPDVGELIVYLSISNRTWSEFIPAFLEEVFDRNVRWILAKYPGLRHVERDNVRSCIRMTQAFNATKTGKRLAAFQSFFLQEIACPKELERNPDKLRILFEEYNMRLGKPPAGIAERLQVHSRKVLSMENWFDYFELVGFAAPSAVDLSNWLRYSITRSSCKRYHSNDATLRFTEGWIEGPDYKLHMDPFNCMCNGGTVVNLKDAKSADSCRVVEEAGTRNRIDICFVVDCTGSMGSWIRQAKAAIQSIIKEVGKKTQFKVIRFALVAYKDHGSGMDGYVLRSHEFTSDLHEIQKYVDGMHAGGGDDAPEAMSCALARAAGLTWNRSAQQMIIHIGDEKPHGLDPSGHDNYPDGCPDGHDALRVAHVLAKQGVVIYNVYCGRACYDGGLTQCFYQALSYITNGQCLLLRDAKVLSQIVIGAAMEEGNLDRMTAAIVDSGMLENARERHKIAREDQLIYEIYHRLKAKKFTTESILGCEEPSKYELKSIETMAYCMDLKQARAMQTKAHEWLHSEVRSSSKIGKPTKKLITEGQVRRWFKRHNDRQKADRFKREGCMYGQPRWQPRCAHERCGCSGLAVFRQKATPWTKPNPREVMKVFKRAGEIANNQTNGKRLTPQGTVAKAPAKSAWGAPKTQQAPQPKFENANPAPTSEAGSNPTPANRPVNQPPVNRWQRGPVQPRPQTGAAVPTPRNLQHTEDPSVRAARGPQRVVQSRTQAGVPPVRRADPSMRSPASSHAGRAPQTNSRTAPRRQQAPIGRGSAPTTAPPTNYRQASARQAVPQTTYRQTPSRQPAPQFSQPPPRQPAQPPSRHPAPQFSQAPARQPAPHFSQAPSRRPAPWSRQPTQPAPIAPPQHRAPMSRNTSYSAPTPPRNPQPVNGGTGQNMMSQPPSRGRTYAHQARPTSPIAMSRPPSRRNQNTYSNNRTNSYRPSTGYSHPQNHTSSLSVGVDEQQVVNGYVSSHFPGASNVVCQDGYAYVTYGSAAQAQQAQNGHYGYLQQTNL